MPRTSLSKQPRTLLMVLALAGCASGAGAGAAGALANVAIASGVGAARVSQGDCFTMCAPGTVCNPKTKLCDALPCHDRCKQDEVCDMSGGGERCVPGGQMSVTQGHEVKPASSAPVGITPPLSSAPSSSPEHPDVPTR